MPVDIAGLGQGVDQGHVHRLARAPFQQRAQRRAVIAPAGVFSPPPQCSRPGAARNSPRAPSVGQAASGAPPGGRGDAPAAGAAGMAWPMAAWSIVESTAPWARANNGKNGAARQAVNTVRRCIRRAPIRKRLATKSRNATLPTNQPVARAWEAYFMPGIIIILCSGCMPCGGQDGQCGIPCVAWMSAEGEIAAGLLTALDAWRSRISRTRSRPPSAMTMAGVNKAASNRIRVFSGGQQHDPDLSECFRRNVLNMVR